MPSVEQPGFVDLLGPLLAERHVAVGDDLVDRRAVESGNAGQQHARGLVDVEPAGDGRRGVHRQVVHQLRQIRLHRAAIVGERRVDDDAAVVVRPASSRLLRRFDSGRLGRLCG